MSKNSKNIDLIVKILWTLWGIIIFLLFIWYKMMYSQLSTIIHQKVISFEICQNYIFLESKSQKIKIQKYINWNDYKVLDLKCFDLFPNKRESFITTQEFSEIFTIPQKQTESKMIDIPENIIWDKSEIFIEFKIPESNITSDVTFFGYSIWKMQNRDGTTLIWAEQDNIINKSFTLEEIYYDENLEFIVTNLMWNDLQVSYSIIYYLKNY